MASTTTWGSGSDKGYDMSLWYDSRPLKVGWFAMLGAVGAEVVFQRVFGYSHGLDSMTPEFENVWMRLWRFNVISNIINASAILGWIWSTRDRNVANVDPKTELKRYFYWMMWLACLRLRRVLGGQLYAGAGCVVASGDHPGHELYRQPYHCVLLHVPALHHDGRRELSVCDDPIAAVQQGGVVPVGGGDRRADDDSAERGAQ